ncbi:MAG: metallophosphoesterase family protein [Dehalococcoidales bacterium]|nr:metallophosphoesterase family protein [Dehalococcoidales bacterium]
MRYAIISDLHANLAAFRAVLDDITNRGGVEKIWCLGDIVGYGPEPGECIELLCQTNHISVAGNHDWGASGKIGINEFNPDAAEACQWTAQQLSPADTDYLKGLPPVIEEENFTLVHGSPREPIWEYLTSTGMAKENFAAFKTQFCLVGHSHVPLVFSRDENGTCSGKRFLPDVKLTLGKDRLIINPGSVGQPRDGNSQASYAIYDTETRVITLHRIPYDIRATQDRMVQLGLPMRLVARLSYGM